MTKLSESNARDPSPLPSSFLKNNRNQKIIDLFIYHLKNYSILLDSGMKTVNVFGTIIKTCKRDMKNHTKLGEKSERYSLAGFPKVLFTPSIVNHGQFAGTLLPPGRSR